MVLKLGGLRTFLLQNEQWATHKLRTSAKCSQPRDHLLTLEETRQVSSGRDAWITEGSRAENGGSQVCLRQIASVSLHAPCFVCEALGLHASCAVCVSALWRTRPLQYRIAFQVHYCYPLTLSHQRLEKFVSLIIFLVVTVNMETATYSKEEELV